MSVATVPSTNTAAAAVPQPHPRPDPSQPPPFVLELYIQAHHAASQALSVLQTVMNTALQAPTEKLPPALNHARLAAGQVLRFASKLLAPSESRASRAPRPATTTAPAPSSKPTTPSAKTPAATPQPTLSSLLNNLIGRAGAGTPPRPPAPVTVAGSSSDHRVR